MTKRPYLNLFFTVLIQSFSLLFLLGYSYKVLDIIRYGEQVTAETLDMQSFIFNCLVLTLVPLIVYIVFFIIQRKKANDRKYLGYLKISTRIILTICVLLVKLSLIVLFCFLPGYHEGSTLFFKNIVDDQCLIFPLIIFVLLNLFPFIFLKPRP